MRRTAPLPLLTLAAPALLALGGCASAPESGFRALAAPSSSPASSSASSPAAARPTTSRTSYVIAGASLPGDRLLIDVVATRWPQMVRGDLPRGELARFTTIDRFGVYDARGTLLGGPTYLESVRAREVVEIRRLTYGEEAAKFGRGHPAGAVILTWRNDAWGR